MKSALYIIGAIVAFLLLIFALNYYSLQSYAFFAQRYTAVDAKVFKQSVQYNDGMLRDLENLELQYQQTDTAGKQALKPIIIHRFEVYDENRLPPNLRNFYESIRGAN